MLILFQFVFLWFCCFHRLQILRYVSMVTEKSIAELYQDLNNLDLYSVQCLVNPSEWVENAYVFKRGNGDEEYSLRFGTSGQLFIKQRHKNLS